ncbi:hypothetical protein [Kutzneria sp. CA-103260]|uniref:hypothetical protein n=1 Tax=Kutzneria sp. CA-103260 TaxID=2802641 RepID=UPI001BAAC1B9|nr:hypothetical protein [Kutzneria sp. CA-103260]QUQ66933.1 hypothetical protein JJ691_46610 [Kutzneria sp. CA-103260]
MSKKTCEFLQMMAALIGIHSGVLPFVFKLIGRGASGLALPLYLPDPASLIVAGSVLVLCVAALWLLENAKNRATS